MNYRNYTRRDSAEVEALLKPAWHTTLQRVLDWARGHDPVLEVTELVAQDEFTHDAVVPYVQNLYLVYDVT